MDELSIRRYIRELNKTYCSLDPINVSKITVAFEAAAPFIASLVNKYFEECIFVTSEKVALLQPTLNPQAPHGVYKPPLVYCWMGFLNTLPFPALHLSRNAAIVSESLKISDQRMAKRY